MTVFPLLSGEARKFCQTTSVRGVSRIVNAKSTTHSVIWLLGVLTCASILIWQLTVLFKRYRSYPVNTVILQSLEADNTTFPDVTVCNLKTQPNIDINYITLDSVIEAINATVVSTDFHGYMEEHFPLVQYDVIYAAYETNAMQQNSYTILFNTIVRTNFTFSYEDSPIIDCRFINWDYSPNTISNCFSSVKQIWDPDYGVCYTMKVNLTEGKNIRGIAALIYVDTVLYNTGNYYNLNIKNLQVTGVRVLTHAPGTKPDMKLGIDGGSGFATTIVLDQTKQTRLPAPYSSCTTEGTLGSVDNSNPYTQPYCVSICQQQQCLDKCGCIKKEFQFTYSQLVESNFSVCSFIEWISNGSSLNFKQLGQMLCDQSFKPNESACYKQCLSPCQEYQYSSNVITTAPWPDSTVLNSFYNSYIMGVYRFGHKFDAYEEWRSVDAEETNSSTDSYLLQTLNIERLFQKNFLQLNIQFNTNEYTIQKEVAAFPLDSFGAQVGGVLSLWLGVTIMLIFEIFEFIINLLHECYRAKRNKQTSEMESVDICVVETRL